VNNSNGTIPAVSVIVPAYNVAEHLSETLTSIANQTLKNIEVLVVDDGSTDATPSIITQFVTADNRFRSVAGPAIGAAGAARNKGLELAQGDFVIFLDGDDLFEPTMIANMYQRATSDQADVVLTGFRELNADGDLSAPQKWAFRTNLMPKRRPFHPRAVKNVLFDLTSPAPWTKLWRTAFLREHQLKFPNLKRAEDLVFVYSALALAQAITTYEACPVSYRRYRPGSLQTATAQAPLEFIAALAELRKVLASNGLLTVYETGFKNVVASTALGALNRTQNYDAFIATYQVVQGQLFPQYQLTKTRSWLLASLRHLNRGTALNIFMIRRARQVLRLTPQEWLARYPAAARRFQE